MRSIIPSTLLLGNVSSDFRSSPKARKSEGIGKWCLEKTIKFTGKVDRYACVDGALLVEESLSPVQREDTFMPDIQMNVETLVSVETKTHEFLRRDVIARQSQRNVERPMVERKEQLSAVRVVVRVT
ncbi:hypothetical protein AYM40_30190 [Paraburkholderia phytofirmans OLGA172]|uniref:Uncharacterized protein n=1 Tax=Paraburkholderia phytofirmans OLGA172 TaxID=1417228 RepID=A0A160FTW1_9BURK|nr:hypothetical protein [Paraburkholderia phytofirmans]ANB76481.1 hypothetical protein AYM40_30190 [Paraburkholderia phytofirmans OLGA172]